jgi:hypothetical protein
LQAESSASVPLLIMQVTKGVWWNSLVGNAISRTCASTARRTRTVCTFIMSGVGVSRFGYRPQLENSSTE